MIIESLKILVDKIVANNDKKDKLGNVIAKKLELKNLKNYHKKFFRMMKDEEKVEKLNQLNYNLIECRLISEISEIETDLVLMDEKRNELQNLLFCKRNLILDFFKDLENLKEIANT